MQHIMSIGIEYMCDDIFSVCLQRVDSLYRVWFVLSIFLLHVIRDCSEIMITERSKQFPILH